MKTFFDLARELEAETNRQHLNSVSGLDFNPSHYKASKEVTVNLHVNIEYTVQVQASYRFVQIRISNDVIHIMTLPPHCRTAEMLQKVRKAGKSAVK